MLVDALSRLMLTLVGGIGGPHDVHSAPVFVGAGDTVACVAQNAGDHTAMMEATLFDADGMAVDAGAAPVAAGRSAVLASSAAAAGFHTCRFVFDGDPANVRGHIHLISAGDRTRALFTAQSTRVGPVVATQLISPPLRRTSIEGTELGCLVHNLSDAAVEVDTEILDEDGAVLDDITLGVLPGRVAVALTSTGALLGASCRFAFTGSDALVRGYATLFGGMERTPHLMFAATPVDALGAVNLWSPPVSSLAGDATSCIVHNVDTVPVAVGAQIIDRFGTVMDDGLVAVPPGEVVAVAGHTEAGQQMVCRFVFADDDLRARAYITRFPCCIFRNTDLLALATRPSTAVGMPATTVSPPLRVQSDGSLRCVAVNRTAADAVVGFRIDDGDGTNLAMIETVVAAGRAQSGSSTSPVSDAVCAFATADDPDNLPGYATLTDDTVQRTELLFLARPPGPPSTHTPSPRPTFTATPTRTATASPTASATRTTSATPTASATASHTPSASATHTASATRTATATPPASATASPLPTTPAATTVTATMGIAPTATPTPGTTPPPTATATASALPTGVAPTPTATTPAAPPCSGDCNGDGSVTIEELIAMVNVALGAPLALCPAGDRSGDGAIAIDELVTAVVHALDGCPALARRRAVPDAGGATARG